MKIKLYWGLAILIILLVGVSVVMLTRTTDTKEINVYKGDVEPSKDNPPPAEPGYKWVWHHNHWDRVPIAQANQPIKHRDIVVKGLTFSQLPEPLQKNILKRNRKVTDTSGELNTHNIPDKKKVNHEELMKILESSELTKSDIETLMSAFKDSQYLEFESPIKSK